MHRVTWDAHRINLRFTRLREKLTLRWGLTPRRFDMLTAMRRQGLFWCPMQTVRKLMGLAASVVSRMIDSLVELGFVVKRRVDGDRRRVEIKITKHGKRTLWCMFRNIIRSGLARRIVGEAICAYPDSAPPDDAKIEQGIGAFGAHVLLNLDDLRSCSWFDYGAMGECTLPGPVDIPVYSEEDLSLWLGDVEPVNEWVARL